MDFIAFSSGPLPTAVLETPETALHHRLKFVCGHKRQFTTGVSLEQSEAHNNNNCDFKLTSICPVLVAKNGKLFERIQIRVGHATQPDFASICVNPSG